MNFGYFDDEHREYVITDPHTPVKWIITSVRRSLVVLSTTPAVP
jgi:cellobiose phosphorylase